MDSATRTLAVGLLGGSVLVLAAGLDPVAGLLLALGGGVGGWLLLGRARRRGLHALLLGLAVAAGGLRAWSSLPARAPAAFSEDVARLRGRVAGPARLHRARHAVPDGAARSEVTFPVELECGTRVHARIRAVDPERPPRLLPGDLVRMVGRASAPRAPSNPGQRDRRARLARDGITAELVVPAPEGVTVTAAGVLDARRAGEGLREAVLRRVTAGCGAHRRAAGLLSCLLVGERHGLSETTRDAFREAGVAHLLAVSGLHVVLLFGVLARGSAWLVPASVRRRLGLPTTLVLLALYCAACRFAVPVMRASLFLGVARAARAAGRRSTTLDHLAVAAAIVVLVDPAQPLDPGFQLSFTAVLGLALLTERFRGALFSHVDLLARFPEALPRWRLWAMQWVAGGVSASLAAHVATAPVVAATYGEIHLLGPLSNLVAVPLVALLLPLAGATALLGSAAAPLLAPIAELGTGALRLLVGALAALPGATVAREPAPAWVVLGALAPLIAAGAIRRWRPVHVLLPAASLVWLLAAPGPRPAPGAEAIVLDVGHGLAVLVRPPGSGAILFDAGARSPSAGPRVIVPALRRTGVRRLAALFVSHDDSDHCDAVPDVLEAFPVGEVVVPAGFGGARAAETVLRRCRALGVPVREVGRGDSWVRADVRVRILHPRRDAVGPAGNVGSIVAHVTLLDHAGVLRLLLPGDLEGPALDALAADRTLPPADVLVLAHHGRGDPEPHESLARRLGARTLIASTSAAAGTDVRGALVTGRDGAVRVRAGEPPRTFPW